MVPRWQSALADDKLQQANFRAEENFEINKYIGYHILKIKRG
jgi:hypothetical protein